MPKLFATFLFACILTSAAAQTDPNERFSFFERKFFQEMRSEWMWGMAPAFDLEPYTAHDGEIRDRGEMSALVISLGGFGYEPRINLYDYSDKASVSLSVPFDFSLGLSVTTPNDQVNTGFFAVATGFFVDANFGNHSTYNNVDMRGYSFGIGYRIHKAPLFGISDVSYDFDRLSTGFAVRAQFKRDTRNDVNKVFYVETGIPQQFKYEGSTHIANTYVLIGFGRVLNY